MILSRLYCKYARVASSTQIIVMIRLARNTSKQLKSQIQNPKKRTNSKFKLIIQILRRFAPQDRLKTQNYLFL